MKEFDYTQVKHYKTYGFIKTVFRPLVKLVYKMRFKGLENIPKGRTNYIVAINHTCAVDPVFVALPKEVPPLHFMAKVELFKNPIAAWFMTRMYAFPVRRGKGDTSAIDYGVKDKDGVPQKAKAGVAVIAKATGADVLPVAICCDGKIKAGKQVTVRYGKLLTQADLGLDREELGPHDIKDAAGKVMDAITALWEDERACK